MPNTLLSCPVCQIPNFSPRGLKAHKCKGTKEIPPSLNLPDTETSCSAPAKIPCPLKDRVAEIIAAKSAKAAKAATPEVTTDQPKDPAWDGIRRTIASVRSAGRAYLFGQAWLGWQLSCKKKDHGCTHGGNRRSSRQLGDLKSWPEIVKEETDFSDRTADRFIQLFEATKAKLKRTKKDAPANKSALILLQSENPLALPPEQREAVQDVIASLCDGETQASLMRELGVVPTPAAPPVGPKKKAEGKLTNEQLAFDFFDGPASAIVKARAAKDYKTLLYMLPATTDQEGKVSLVFLRDETAAMLDDINEALAAHAKPAKSKS